jgi:phenylacetyl-CoA:acceptor oxidoreductase subunit 1
MVVDINRCIGCQTCTIACKDINDTPPGVQWRRVLDVEQGTFPDVERLFLVVGCQHCEEPPCVPVCPSGATAQRADGLVTMDYDTCIGCGYCAVACPYQARTIVHDKKWFYGEETVQERVVSHDDRLGVANKCTFCKERLDDGLAQGLTPGVDPEATPMCSSSCIARAIHFGDFNNPDSNVSQLTRDNQSFQMHEELGTNPQIRYLYETPAVPGREASAADTDDERLADPANPLVGKRQTFWDLRAAVNFTMGGFSSGLAALACLLHFAGIVHERWLMGLYLVAGVCMALGLFFVFLEIGRKLRFLNVLRRPQSSWMTRETYVVAVFYPALLADLIWPSAALHLLIGLAAAAFLFCQARILYAGKGIPAWRHPLIPWMLAATGLAEGAAFITLSGHLAAPTTPWLSPVAALALILTLVIAGLWWRYRATAKANGIPPLARADLGRAAPWVQGVGHALPVALFIVALVWSGAPAWVTVLAGLAVLAGGALWKTTVVAFASYQQGFALPRMPQRGSGARAAPARYGVAEPRPSTSSA